MTTRLEIEAAIKQLPERDLRQFAAWLQTYLDDRWDMQMRSGLSIWKIGSPDRSLPKQTSPLTK